MNPCNTKAGEGRFRVCPVPGLSHSVCLPVHTAGRRRFYQAPVIVHRVIEAESSGQIIRVISAACQDPYCNIAAQPALAHHIDWFSLLNLIDPLTKLIHRDIDKILNMSAALFSFCPNVEQNRASVTGQLLHILRMELL